MTTPPFDDLIHPSTRLSIVALLAARALEAEGSLADDRVLDEPLPREGPARLRAVPHIVMDPPRHRSIAMAPYRALLLRTTSERTSRLSPHYRYARFPQALSSGGRPRFSSVAGICGRVVKALPFQAKPGASRSGLRSAGAPLGWLISAGAPAVAAELARDAAPA
jgi:hypothetical protein